MARSPISGLLKTSRCNNNPGQYLIATAALPIATRVVEASPERPYLAICLKLDLHLVGAVMIEASHLIYKIEIVRDALIHEEGSVSQFARSLERLSYHSFASLGVHSEYTVRRFVR